MPRFGLNGTICTMNLDSGCSPLESAFCLLCSLHRPQAPFHPSLGILSPAFWNGVSASGQLLELCGQDHSPIVLTVPDLNLSSAIS